MNKKLLRFGLGIFVFLLPFQTRYIFSLGSLNNGPWTFGDISIYAIDILLLLLLILAWRAKLFQRANFSSFLFWPIIVLLVASILSLLNSVLPSLAIFRFGQLLMSILVFFLFSTALRAKIIEPVKLWLCFLASGVLQAILGLWQFFSQSSFACKWLGMAMHDPMSLGVSVVETIANDGWPERWLRAYGGLDHPNVLGGVLAISAIIAIVLIIKENHSKQKIFLWTALSIIIAGLFVSFSRAGWLAFAIGLLVLILRNLKLWKKIIPPFLLVIAIVSAFYLPYGYLAKGRLDNPDVFRLEEKSINERIGYNQQAFALIKKHFLLGVGLGNFGTAVHKELDSKQTSWSYQPVHNFWLLSFSECGILALLCCLLIFLLTIKYIWKQEKNLSISFGSSILAVILILTFFDHWLWSLRFGQFFFWLIFALIINTPTLTDNNFKPKIEV